VKVTKFPLSRKYVRLASVYRRFAERSPHFDFSLHSLIECFNHESRGTPVSSHNGYKHGKWMKDITVAQWIEDIGRGDMCKAEFLTPLNRWWATKALSNVVAAPLFGYRS
jgi:hypothetical protein